MENKKIRCRFITYDEFEQSNIKGDYFNNSAKIISNGYETYCCSETIICSLAHHLNDGTLQVANKKIKNSGAILEYTFTCEENNTDIVVNIPTRLTQDKFVFIENDIRQLDKLMINTNKINTKRKIKLTLEGLAATITLLLTIQGIKIIIDHRAKNIKEKSIYDYYEGTMDPNDVYEMAKELQKNANKTLIK